MKLLFDEHFSFRLVRALQDVFPEAKHVKYYNLESEADDRIWHFAKNEGYTIVTKDDDFHQRSITFGHPPKIVWLKVGNLKRQEIEAILRNRSQRILDFVLYAEESLFVIEAGEGNPAL